MGWGDRAELKEFLRKKKEFEAAGNKYHNFLAHAQRYKILPEDKFS